MVKIEFWSCNGKKRRNNEKAVGIDYDAFESGSVAFDYEGMMRETGYSLEEIREYRRKLG